MKRGEGIRCNFRASPRDSREQRGFAGVRITYQPDFGNDAQFEQEIAFIARLAWLSETRGLSGGGGKVAISEAPAAAFTQHKTLPILREVGNQVAMRL